MNACIPDVLNGLGKRFAWHANRLLLRNLWLLDLIRGRLTVIDHFGVPGDTLLTATVCRIIKKRHPRLRINCVTRNPDLLELDPDLAEVNGPQSFCHLSFEYLGILETRGSKPNVLACTLADVGIRDYSYHARVYLRPDEIAEARQRLPDLQRPVIAINVMSKELVKVWGIGQWRQLVARLVEEYTVVQLGDASEPSLDGVVAFGGQLTKRQSMAVLALACVHIGPDSFLMHAANGLDVPSVIIYGGSRPPSCLGYEENRNLYVQLECSPCWLQTTRGDSCPYEMKCMQAISVDQVYRAVSELTHQN